MLHSPTQEAFRRRRWSRTPLAVALAFSILLSATGLVLAQDSTLLGPSPAKGHVQVVAQGMTAPPDAKSAWRVVERTIPLRTDARPSDRLSGATGFLVAGDAPIFVTDQDTKLRYRLASGEAEFVARGANQTWASLDSKPATAYSIELASRSDVKDVDEGTLLYSSGGFTMAEGDYDLDLLRDSVRQDEKSSMNDADYPVLIFVTAGEIEIRSDQTGSKAVTLKSGEAETFSGNLTTIGVADARSEYLAAVLGASIGGGAAPNPTATPQPSATAQAKPTKTPKDEATQAPVAAEGDAQVNLTIAICPAGFRPEQGVTEGCAPAKGGFDVQLVKPNGKKLRLKDARKVTDSTVRWTRLAAGEYQLLIKTYPDGYNAASLDGYVCCTAGGGFTLVIADGTKVTGTLYFFLPADSGVEVAAPAAPVASAANPGVDSDGDGVSDEQEASVFGTSPNQIDSDGDTIPDGVEAYGTNGYLTAPSKPDTDGDGVNDNVEIAAGTNPNNPGSKP